VHLTQTDEAVFDAVLGAAAAQRTRYGGPAIAVQQLQIYDELVFIVVPRRAVELLGE
jgi:hypothetical protein